MKIICNYKIFIILLLLLINYFYCEATAQTTTTATDNDDDNDEDVEEKEDEQQQQDGGTIIGIDLGTTYSCVGVFSTTAGSKKIEIVANDQGNRITPSYVAFTSATTSSADDKRLLLVGDAAKNQATLNPTNTIFDVKRLIGRNYNDKSVIADSKLLPYKIINNNGRPYIQIEQQKQSSSSSDDDDTTTTSTTSISTYAPEEISAMILQKLKITAERYLGKEINRAVITVPAYFNDAQRKATKDAGIISGLQVERIINEPTAAAMAYGLQQQQQQKQSSSSTDSDEEEQNILVFDLGGGTFDVTILTIDEGIFQVLSTNGNTHLGGSDFDQTIMSYYIKKYEKNNNPSKAKGIRTNTRALQKLRKEVERVKRALSNQLTANIEIDDLMPGLDISDTLSRAKFESLNHNLFIKTLKPVQLALDDAGLSKNEIDEIILVGGSTRIPKIQELLMEYFDGKQLNKSINPDEAVAYGATIQGSILSGEYNAASSDNDDDFNQIMLLDVTPLSLGTSIDDGLMSVLIKRGTTIPTEKSDTYHTLKANQKSMTIDVYEGERSLVKDNHFLGEFEMTNLPPGPAESVEVDVTFKLDVNGILEVYAETKATKDSKRITIEQTKTNRLTQNEIDRMIEEAAQHAHEDKLIVEKIDARNRLESYVYTLIDTIDEHTDIMLQADTGITESKLSKLELLLEKTIDWIDNISNHHIDLESNDYNDKYKEIENVANPIMKQFYESNVNKRQKADPEEQEL